MAIIVSDIASLQNPRGEHPSHYQRGLHGFFRRRRALAVDEAFDTVRSKVAALFAEFAGDRAKWLDASTLATPAMDTIGAALAGQYGPEKAAEIGLHMADWNADAAFVVALHLFPERFTAAEVSAGVGLFLAHAPNHIREACRLTDAYVWESFSGDAKPAEPGAAPDPAT
jgi:hypothetical protein